MWFSIILFGNKELNKDGLGQKIQDSFYAMLANVGLKKGQVIHFFKHFQNCNNGVECKNFDPLCRHDRCYRSHYNYVICSERFATNGLSCSCDSKRIELVRLKEERNNILLAKKELLNPSTKPTVEEVPDDGFTTQSNKVNRNRMSVNQLKEAISKLEDTIKALSKKKRSPTVEKESLSKLEEELWLEELIDGILSECLVFYSGHPSVKEYIDDRAFVYLELEDFEKDYHIIKKAMNDNWWSIKLPYIKKEKEKILNELQFFPRLCKIINET
jgi:hypothetical protein